MAQGYRIVFTPEAREGLQSIVEYLEEKASYAIADKVRKGILEASISFRRCFCAGQAPLTPRRGEPGRRKNSILRKRNLSFDELPGVHAPLRHRFHPVHA